MRGGEGFFSREWKILEYRGVFLSFCEQKLKALRAKIYHFRVKKIIPPPLPPGIYTTVIILFYRIDQDVIQIFKNTKKKIVIGKTGNLILVNENSKFKTYARNLFKLDHFKTINFSFCFQNIQTIIMLEIYSNSTILKQLISVFVFRTFRQ